MPTNLPSPLWIGVGLALVALAFFLILAKPAPQAAKPKPLASKPPATKPPTKAPPKAAPAPPPERLPMAFEEGEDDEDITIVTLGPLPGQGIPKIQGSDDDIESDTETTVRVEEGAVPIVYDDEAAIDEPTHPGDLILVSAVAQSDPGKRRKKNEDSYLAAGDLNLFTIADGMGGHAGGEVASKIACDMIGQAFRSRTFVGRPYPNVPLRGSEVVQAIQMANHAVYEHAKTDRKLEGMGTTIVAARFSANKQRLYIGHVGDSRCYRLRAGQLRQMTTDHTMGNQGLTGPLAERLSRAVGVQHAVKIDLILARPVPMDTYLLCSDGLTKMVKDDDIRDVLVAEKDVKLALEKLIARANDSGGRDNITAILVQVR
jgi:protein phosphatase